MKAVIIYYSHTGMTAAYARAITMYLWQQGVTVSMMASADYTPEKTADADMLLLGCWTSGWFIVHQHPHKKWKAFAKQIPANQQGQLLLFTTYLIRPGSMFRNMYRRLPKTLTHKQQWRMASKRPILSEADKLLLKDFVQAAKDAKNNTINPLAKTS